MRMVKWGAAGVFKEKTHLRTRQSHELKLHSADCCWSVSEQALWQFRWLRLSLEINVTHVLSQIFHQWSSLEDLAASILVLTLWTLSSCLKYILYCSLGLVQWIPAHYWEVHTKETYNKAVQLTKGNSCVYLFFTLHTRFQLNQCSANC